MKQPSALLSSYLDKLRKRNNIHHNNNKGGSLVADEEEAGVSNRCKEMSLVSFMPVSSSGSSGTIKKGPMRAGGDGQAPRPRSGHRMCADDNYLYIFGGYNPAFKTFSELWRFNTTTERWYLMPDDEGLAPTASASSSMVMVGPNLFVFGGTGYPFAVSNSETLSMYSLKMKRWYDLSTNTGDGDGVDFITSHRQKQFSKYPKNYTKEKSCGCRRCYDSQPSPKYGHGMAILQNKIFIHSGTQGEVFMNEMHSFCLKSFRWSSYHFCGTHSRHEPKPRYRHELVALGNRLQVVGGAVIESTFPLDIMESFHLDTQSWHNRHCCTSTGNDHPRPYSRPEQQTIPVGRKAHSCVAFRDELYVCGGYSSEKGQLDDFWSYDSRNDLWKQHKEVCYFV